MGVKCAWTHLPHEAAGVAKGVCGRQVGAQDRVPARHTPSSAPDPPARPRQARSAAPGEQLAASWSRACRHRTPGTLRDRAALVVARGASLQGAHEQVRRRTDPARSRTRCQTPARGGGWAGQALATCCAARRMCMGRDKCTANLLSALRAQASAIMGHSLSQRSMHPHRQRRGRARELCSSSQGLVQHAPQSPGPRTWAGGRPPHKQNKGRGRASRMMGLPAASAMPARSARKLGMSQWYSLGASSQLPGYRCTVPKSTSGSAMLVA